MSKTNCEEYGGSPCRGCGEPKRLVWVHVNCGFCGDSGREPGDSPCPRCPKGARMVVRDREDRLIPFQKLAAFVIDGGVENLVAATGSQLCWDPHAQHNLTARMARAAEAEGFTVSRGR